jgi:hypothetical protein
MVVNLVPSGMFLSFLFKAEDYIDKRKKRKDSMEEVEEGSLMIRQEASEDDSVIEELHKEEGVEEKQNEKDVIRIEGIYTKL